MRAVFAACAALVMAGSAVAADECFELVSRPSAVRKDIRVLSVARANTLELTGRERKAFLGCMQRAAKLIVESQQQQCVESGTQDALAAVERAIYFCLAGSVETAEPVSG